MFYSLAYESQASAPLTASDLLDLLEHSRANNARREVTGILLYRHAAMIDGGDEGNMSLAAAELLVESAIEECERFYPVFQFVLWGGKTPSDAIAAALIDTQGEA